MKKQKLLNKKGFWLGLSVFNGVGIVAMLSQLSFGGVAVYVVLLVITLLVYKMVANGKELVKEPPTYTPKVSTNTPNKTQKKPKEVFFSNEDIIVYDLETTGVDYNTDEILQLAIINGNGETLFNSYFRPEHKRRWPKAEELNHISWKMVKDKPPIKDSIEQLLAIIYKSKLIVGYNNKRFDNNFLEAVDYRFYQAMKNKTQYDVMLKYAEYKGVWDSYHDGYKWFRLDQASKHFGYKPTGQLHDALEDCKATLWVLQHLEKTEEREQEDVKNN